MDKIKLYKRFIIFGAGRLGHQVYHILAERGAEAALFCDNRLCGRTDADTGLKVISLTEFEWNKAEVFVMLAIFDEVDCRAVYRQLLEFGFADDHLMNVRNIAWREPLSFLRENIDKYKGVYSLLEDDFSKVTYVNMIKKHYLDEDISKIVCCGPYFDQEIMLADKEVFVDCGGYSGEFKRICVRSLYVWCME